MKRNTIVTVIISSCIVGIALLYTRISIKSTQSIQSGLIVPSTPTVQQVEYFIDRYTPLDAMVTATMTPAQSATPSSAPELKSVSDKYEMNYPYNRIFPYRSYLGAISYKLVPKRLYIETTLDDASAMALLNSYLKSNNLTRADLEQKGVIITVEHAPKEADALSRD